VGVLFPGGDAADHGGGDDQFFHFWRLTEQNKISKLLNIFLHIPTDRETLSNEKLFPGDCLSEKKNLFLRDFCDIKMMNV
jgi:hypothetical protein